MGTHYFIDETKAKNYVLAAVMCPDVSLAVARRTIGKLVLPGQRSVHMKHEGARRRAQIADAVCGLRVHGIVAVVLDAGPGPHPEYIRRDRALRALVVRAAPSAAPTLVLDLDHTLLARDARSITEASRCSGNTAMTFSHQTLASQPLLTLPDVVAWCWARGGDWRRRVAPMIAESITV